MGAGAGTGPDEVPPVPDGVMGGRRVASDGWFGSVRSGESIAAVARLVWEPTACRAEISPPWRSPPRLGAPHGRGGQLPLPGSAMEVTSARTRTADGEQCCRCWSRWSRWSQCCDDQAVAPDPVDPAASASSPASARRAWRPWRLIAGIVVLTTVTTVALAAAAWRIDRASEQRLLWAQTRQAGLVLTAAIGTLLQPMESTLGAAASLPPGEGGRALGTTFSRYAGPGRLFAHGSLWTIGPDAASPQLDGDVGEPRRAASDAAFERFLRRAATTTATAQARVIGGSPRVIVMRIRSGDDDAIGYATAQPAASGEVLVMYAERQIPRNRRASIEGDRAFAGLDYAVYLGPGRDLASMTTTNLAPDRLPLRGRTAQVSVPFGDQTLTIVARSPGHLGSGLSQRLPAILLLAGVAIGLVAVGTARRLSQARMRAERDTATIQVLHDRLDHAYGEQSETFNRLQRALLPQGTPEVCGAHIATTYRAASAESEIGGDWFSVVATAPDRLAFAVGDISGHGIDTVADMARARFTLRAFLAEGASPADALARVAAQFAANDDWRIATAVAATLDTTTGELVVCSAGHPPPLIISGHGGAEFVGLEPSPPLGLVATTYEETRSHLGVGDTLLMFTDGLVERRGEAIDAGLRRLQDRAALVASTAIDDIIGVLMESLVPGEAADDVAALALRRHG